MTLLSWFEPDDPGLGWRRRVRFDAVLGLVLFLVMIDRLTGNIPHELLGTLLGAAFGVHMLLNASWYRRLVRPSRRRRKPGVASRFTKVLTLALTAAGIGSVITGIAASQSVFAFATPELWRMDLEVRTWHVGASLWFFLLAGMQFGFHGGVFLGPLEQKTGKKLHPAVLSLISALLVPGGVLAFGRRDLAGLLAFESAYIPVEREEWMISMPLDLLVLFLGCAALAAGLRLLPEALARLRSKKKENRRKNAGVLKEGLEAK